VNSGKLTAGTKIGAGRRGRKSTVKQRQDWFKGEMLLGRAMLHVQQQYALYPGDFPGAEGDPHTYLARALARIRRERREAGR